MIKNAKTLPKVYYGLHMCEGVAEYSEPDSEPYRIMIGEECLKAMDPTFQGKPLYVEHVDEVNLDNLQNEADGYVMESFYNPPDGKHWAKFIVVSDEGHRAIQQGWKLSNAYVPKNLIGGGLWHGVEYSKEIVDGEYEHLAIVRNPRYEESIILTPEEFKEYNREKEMELMKLANSKEGDKKMSKLNFFKRQKVENSIDLEAMLVSLPKSGKEKSIAQLVNEADEHEMKKNDAMADLSHKVKMHDGSMCNVGELLEKHKALQDELKAMKDEKEKEKELDLEVEPSDVDVEGDKHNDEEVMEDDESEDAEAKKKALELAEHEEKEIEAAKKKNAAEEKARKRKNFEALKNAPRTVQEETAKVELSEDMVARGKARYGSAS